MKDYSKEICVCYGSWIIRDRQGFFLFDEETINVCIEKWLYWKDAVDYYWEQVELYTEKDV